ncbi:hypothetical protein [Paratractidigestivibacter faecalis]|uniref:hypothetical protein n=1 Tax=Paratractidigestivibacter faecalis TaxID=2292441 RepID=UPI000E3B7F95|nr:hypothetical protein [Paratractidigestivibacter faecalis]
MQRTYGMDMDRVLDGTVSVPQAAACAACLPLGSLCLAAEDEEAGWTREEILTLALVNSWRSEPIDPFRHKAGVSMDVDAYAEYLARPRSEVPADGGDAA